MTEIDDIPLVEMVARWLKEGDEHKAADIIEECLLDIYYVDTLFEINGERTYNQIDIQVAAPRKVLKKCSSQYAPFVKQIESAIEECLQVDGTLIRGINWVARTGNGLKNPAEDEITQILSNMDSMHVQRAWKKAVSRKNDDPDGAITAARTLLETVCMRILEDFPNAECPRNPGLPKLYHITSEQLSLAPTEYTEQLIRRVLGNCQAVVGGLAALRNDVGDAHGKSTSDITPNSIHAELAVNLAGAMATFLVSSWEAMKDSDSPESKSSND